VKTKVVAATVPKEQAGMAPSLIDPIWTNAGSSARRAEHRQRRAHMAVVEARRRAPVGVVELLVEAVDLHGRAARGAVSVGEQPVAGERAPVGVPEGAGRRAGARIAEGDEDLASVSGVSFELWE
jgi:hypothetical protein